MNRVDRKVTLKHKLLYGSGDIYGGGAFLVISLLFLRFLTDVQLLAPALASLIISAGVLWDGITDVLMGMFSDSTESKYGRRRVYFLAGIIPVFMSFFMLWYSFGIQSQIGLFIYFFIAYVLFDVSFTMVMVPYTAILTDLTADYKERASYSGFRLTFSTLSAIIAGVVPMMIVNRFPNNTKLGFMIMGLCFGLFYALPWILVFCGTWEQPRESKKEEEEKLNFKQYFETVFKNKSFRAHAGMFISSQTATDFLTTLFTYYLSYYLGRGQDFSLVLGVLLVVQVLVMPVHIRISKKYGKTTPLKIGAVCWIGAMLLALWVRPGQSLVLVFAIAAISAIGTAAAVFVPWSIISEVADVDEIISTKRREGIYCGMATLLRKAARSITILVIGLVLQRIGYVANIEQAEHVKTGIKLLFSLSPIIFLLLALYFTSKYKMTEEKYLILTEEIKRRKSGGLKEQVERRTQEVCEELTGLPYEKLWNGK